MTYTIADNEDNGGQTTMVPVYFVLILSERQQNCTTIPTWVRWINWKRAFYYPATNQRPTNYAQSDIFSFLITAHSGCLSLRLLLTVVGIFHSYRTKQVHNNGLVVVSTNCSPVVPVPIVSTSILVTGLSLVFVSCAPRNK